MKFKEAYNYSTTLESTTLKDTIARSYRLVDTRDGHIKKIKGSGEVPEYCLRPDFGQMPAYLVKRNRKIQKALDNIKYAEDNRESLCKLINEQERQKLLDVSLL